MKTDRYMQNNNLSILTSIPLAPYTFIWALKVHLHLQNRTRCQQVATQIMEDE